MSSLEVRFREDLYKRLVLTINDILHQSILIVQNACFIRTYSNRRHHFFLILIKQHDVEGWALFFNELGVLRSKHCHVEHGPSRWPLQPRQFNSVTVYLFLVASRERRNDKHIVRLLLLKFTISVDLDRNRGHVDI